MPNSNKTLSINQQTNRLYWRFTRPYMRQNIELLIYRPAFTLSAYVGNVYLASLALDKLAKNSGTVDFRQDFGPIILAIIVLESIRLITEQLSLKVLWETQVKTMNNMGRYMYDNLISRDTTFHANHFTGSLVSQANKFISAYERLHDTVFWNVYALIINTIATFVLLFIKLPAYSAVLLVLVVLYTWYSSYANRRARQLSSNVARAETAATGQLADSITNIQAVKSYARETFESERYQKRLDAIKKANDQARSYTISKDSKLSGIVSIAGILALVMSITAVSGGRATVGAIALATALTRDTLMRLREFNSSTLRNIARAYGDAEEMTKILLTPTDVRDPAVPLAFTPSNGTIDFKNVTFWYPEKSAKDVLFKNLNLHVEQGEKIGLVGPSGGGKTTITKLLLRFLDIQDGDICIDGQNIAHSAQTDVRSYISYVPQEPLLFHRSITENIRYGVPHASDKQVAEAAKKAHAHEFIAKLPEGYDTLVGERGVKLSGGQRQRIAIARAMLKNAPILVLDEATSALDSEAEVLIQDALWKLMANKTTLVIAHRLSTIQKMDRIIVLKDGQIVEQGAHNQLLNNKQGLYAKLWSHQSGGFLKES